MLLKCCRILFSEGIRSLESNSFSTSSKLFAAPTSSPRLPTGYNAPTPYAQFVKDHMVGQSGRITEAMKNISVQWNSLSEHDKQPYIEKYKKLSAQLKEEFEKLSENKKKELFQKQAEKLNKTRRIRMKRELHKFRSTTNRPKQPQTSFLLFMQDLRDRKPTQFANKEEAAKFSAEAGEKWKNMSLTDKQPYIDKAAANKEAYHRELKEWEEKHETEIKQWKDTHKKLIKKKKTEGKRKPKQLKARPIAKGDGEKKLKPVQRKKRSLKTKTESKEGADEKPKKTKAEEKPVKEKKRNKSDVKGAAD